MALDAPIGNRYAAAVAAGAVAVRPTGRSDGSLFQRPTATGGGGGHYHSRHSH